MLPYFQKKYPQSETSQVNLRLSNKLETIDNYLNNSNDIVFKSQVEFEYNEYGEYNKQIMSVLNYIINTPNKKPKFEISDDDLIDLKQCKG